MNTLQPYNFVFELPLYTEVEINDNNKDELLRLLDFRGKVDAYNPMLKQESTFQVSPPLNYNSRAFDLFNSEGFHEFKLTCVRNNYQINVFALLFNSRDDDDEEYEDDLKYTFVKIGQFPSIADLHISKVKNYDKVLSKEKIREMTRAIGLAANGVGIGSYVYLRRIFEHLIEEAHLLAKTEPEWKEIIFLQSRMTDKINLLKKYLPDFLVANKNMYGILSLGIHELTEQQCLSYFEALKVGIELILDEKVEKQIKENKLKEAQAKIQQIEENIKKP